MTACEVVVALQTIVAREESNRPCCCGGKSWQLNAGTRYNIVANDAEIEAMIPAFSHETRAHLKEAVTRIAKGIAELNRCEFEN